MGTPFNVCWFLMVTIITCNRCSIRSYWFIIQKLCLLEGWHGSQWTEIKCSESCVSFWHLYTEPVLLFFPGSWGWTLMFSSIRSLPSSSLPGILMSKRASVDQSWIYYSWMWEQRRGTFLLWHSDLCFSITLSFDYVLERLTNSHSKWVFVLDPFGNQDNFNMQEVACLEFCRWGHIHFSKAILSAYHCFPSQHPYRCRGV